MIVAELWDSGASPGHKAQAWYQQ